LCKCSLKTHMISNDAKHFKLHFASHLTLGHVALYDTEFP